MQVCKACIHEKLFDQEQTNSVFCTLRMGVCADELLIQTCLQMEFQMEYIRTFLSIVYEYSDKRLGEVFWILRFTREIRTQIRITQQYLQENQFTCEVQHKSNDNLDVLQNQCRKLIFCKNSIAEVLFIYIQKVNYFNNKLHVHNCWSFFN